MISLDKIPTRTLDCTGLLCPLPIIKTAQIVQELEAGEVLEIIADDPGIVEDMPAWCESTGHECMGVEKKGRIFNVLVKKTGPSD